MSLKDSGKLAGNIISAGLGDAKKFFKTGAKKGTEAGKRLAEEVLHHFDLTSDEIKKQLKEMKDDLSGIMDDTAKDSITSTLRNIPRNSQIKIVENLSAENRKKIAELSGEMNAIIKDCVAEIEAREKLIFQKVQTVADLSEVLKKLMINVDLRAYSPKAPVFGVIAKRKDEEMVNFYLVVGDYGKMTRIYSLPVSLLYK